MRIRHTPRTCRSSVPLVSTSPGSRTPSCGSEDRRASTTLARHRHRIGVEYPDLDSNQGLDLRRVRCNPLHHRDRKSGKSRRLDSHQHEPVYKTGAFLGRATSAILEQKRGVRGESNPPPRPSQGRMPNRDTTNTIWNPAPKSGSGFSGRSGSRTRMAPRGARPASSQLPSPIGWPFRELSLSSSTRTRTWNAGLEARHDVHFTIEPGSEGAAQRRSGRHGI